MGLGRQYRARVGHGDGRRRQRRRQCHREHVAGGPERGQFLWSFLCTVLLADIVLEIATRIIDLCLKELFVFRAMQTDPNWTNFLWNKQTRRVRFRLFHIGRPLRVFDRLSSSTSALRGNTQRNSSTTGSVYCRPRRLTTARLASTGV